MTIAQVTVVNETIRVEVQGVSLLTPLVSAGTDAATAAAASATAAAASATQVANQQLTSGNLFSNRAAWNYVADPKNGATSSSTLFKLTIPAASTGNDTYAAARAVISDKPWLVGATVRFKTEWIVTAGFLANKPPSSQFYGRMVTTAGTGINLAPTTGAGTRAATLARSEQIGTVLYREVDYVVQAGDATVGAGFFISGADTADPEMTATLRSVSWQVVSLPAENAPGDTTMDKMFTARLDASDKRISLGNVLSQMDTSETAAAGGAVLVRENGQDAGWTIAAGQTGVNSTIYGRWAVDGAALVGQTVRLTAVFAASATLTGESFFRAVQMVDAVGAVTNITPTSSVWAVSAAGTNDRIWTVEVAITSGMRQLRFALVQNSSTVRPGAEYLILRSITPQWLTARSEVTTALDTNVQELNALAVLKARTEQYARVVTVKADGTGDYTHPKLALDAISGATASNRILIAVYPGTYSGHAEWFTKDWVDIIGIGRRAEIIIAYANLDSASAATIQNTSTLWLASQSKIENVTVQITNGRYAIHRETNGSKPGIINQIVNCIVEHLGNPSPNNTWTSRYGAGCGNSEGEIYRDRGTIFRGPDGGFSMHNPNNASYNKGAHADFEACEFDATDPTKPDLWIKPIRTGAGDTVRLVGCTLGRIYYGDNGEWQVPADVTSNRAQIAVYGYGNSAFTFTNGCPVGRGKDYAPQMTGMGGAVTLA